MIIMKYFISIFVLFLPLIIWSAQPAYADCGAPVGVAGEMGYSLTGSGSMEYCNGTNWISMDAHNTGAALIGHWALNETMGSVVADTSSGANDGTWSDGSGNSVTEETVVGEHGAALHFDGSDDHINIGNPANLQFTGSMSVAAWVNGDSYPEIKHIVSKQGDTPDYGWRLGTSGAGGNFVMGVSETGVAMTDRRSVTSPVAGQWYHVVGVYNAATQELNIYVNGVLDNGTLVGTVPAAQYNSSRNVNIGRRSALNRYFDGKIDDVRIYNIALDADMIADLFPCTAPGRIDYDTDGHVMRACNTDGVFHTVGAAGAGGAGCGAGGSKAAGVEGTMQYDAANNKMVFCDGVNWVSIPN